jgi:hypothetical protein
MESTVLISREYPTLHGARASWQKAYVIEVLRRHGGNVAAAATELAIDRAHLHRLLRGYAVVIVIKNTTAARAEAPPRASSASAKPGRRGPSPARTAVFGFPLETEHA